MFRLWPVAVSLVTCSGRTNRRGKALPVELYTWRQKSWFGIIQQFSGVKLKYGVATSSKASPDLRRFWMR